jgi:hypothetical protein
MEVELKEGEVTRVKLNGKLVNPGGSDGAGAEDVV